MNGKVGKATDSSATIIAYDVSCCTFSCVCCVSLLLCACILCREDGVRELSAPFTGVVTMRPTLMAFSIGLPLATAS